MSGRREGTTGKGKPAQGPMAKLSELLAGKLIDSEGVPVVVRRGEYADRPFSLAIVGRTNGGKSTLLNAMFGQPVAVEKLVADTTDKVYRVALPNGNVLYDTPGTSGVAEAFEKVTRGFLGLENNLGAPVPVCHAGDEGRSCPHRWTGLTSDGRELVFDPHAFDGSEFELLRRKHQLDPGNNPWEPKLCRRDHDCTYLKDLTPPESGKPGSQDVDVVLHVINVRQIGKDVRNFATELRRWSQESQIPVISALTYRSGETDAEVRDVLIDLEAREQLEVIPVDCKNDPESLALFMRALMRSMPGVNLESFSEAVDKQFRMRRPEMLGYRVAEAALVAADLGNLRTKVEVGQLLEDMKLLMAEHYDLSRRRAKRGMKTSRDIDAAIDEMELPAERARELKEEAKRMRGRLRGAALEAEEEARSKVLQNFASRALNYLFDAFDEEIEEERKRLVAEVRRQHAHVSQLQGQANALQKAAPERTKVATQVFVFLATVLYRLEQMERGRPSGRGIESFKLGLRKEVLAKETALHQALEVGNRLAAKEVLTAVATWVADTIAAPAAVASGEHSAPTGSGGSSASSHGGQEIAIGFSHGGREYVVAYGVEASNEPVELSIDGELQAVGRIEKVTRHDRGRRVRCGDLQRGDDGGQLPLYIQLDFDGAASPPQVSLKVKKSQAPAKRTGWFETDRHR